MESVRDRVCKVFSETGLSQSELARKLDVTPAYIWKILNKEDAMPSDRFLKSICSVFDINQEYLLNGTGEMFVKKTMDQELSEFAADLMMDEEDSFRRRLIRALSKLDEKQWEVLEQIAKELSQKK